mmetsp:Transcript_2477/g.3265  ORF Transcript_2477/g.3265 Transcript_2477/m.3265 type:complete len:200 (-) Transcript_2477:15-614(-)
MILILDERHKNDLQFIKEQSEQVIKEFVNISLEFLRKGSNPKLFVGAAKALGVEVRQIEAVVEGIAQLFREASSLFISDADFLATLVVLGFSDEINQQLKELYLANRSEIRALEKQSTFDLPHFRNLDWRLDIQLASRCLRGQVEPVFTLQLDTISNGEQQSQYLQTDYVNLKHLCEELEIALKELKSPYCRRIMRNIK